MVGFAVGGDALFGQFAEKSNENQQQEAGEEAQQAHGRLSGGGKSGRGDG
jgi:hypothetical protein